MWKRSIVAGHMEESTSPRGDPRQRRENLKGHQAGQAIQDIDHSVNDVGRNTNLVIDAHPEQPLVTSATRRATSVPSASPRLQQSKSSS